MVEHNGSGCNMAENINQFKQEIKKDIHDIKMEVSVSLESMRQTQLFMTDVVVELKEHTKYLADLCNQNEIKSLARDAEIEKELLKVSYESQLANVGQDLSGVTQTVSKFDKIKDLIISGVIGMGFAWLLLKFGIK